MGIVIEHMVSYYEFGEGYNFKMFPKQVLDLASKSIDKLLNQNGTEKISHLIVATTCPDSVAPSLGQEINQKYNPVFSKAHAIDIVQGCAGGVSALLLASQLVELNKSTALVVMADAARKATSTSNQNYKIFGNGSFACLVRPDGNGRKLIHHKSQQFKDLVEVVHIKLGHDSEPYFKLGKKLEEDPRKYLGLVMENKLAIELYKNAKQFYLDFLEECCEKPDIMVVHQVNSRIIKYLKATFENEVEHFVDFSDESGNCGTASVGIALDNSGIDLEGKKVFIGSFGTGGVITAGLWQF
jgi:3-oxoacyl-[acyl-carrier-protein] synthase III